MEPEPVLRFASLADWEAWLDTNHASCSGLWVELGKKGSRVPRVAYAEALDGALAFGWIDGQKRSGDQEHYLQRFTPRTRRSAWSQVNQAKVEALAAAGRMRPSGTASVEAAKADGRWERSYPGQGSMEVPDDLRRALEGDPVAAAFFAGLNRSQRWNILHAIHQARREDTRARRVARCVQRCREHTVP